MFHQYGFGRSAGCGVLRHPREFQLHHARIPLSDGLLQAGPEGIGIELLHRIRTLRAFAVVAPFAPHQNDFGAKLQQFLRGGSGRIAECQQHQIEFFRRAAHQVVHADRSPVGQRIGQVGGCDHHNPAPAGCMAGKRRHAAITQRQNLFFAQQSAGRFLHRANPRNIPQRIQCRRVAAHGDELEPPDSFPPQLLEQVLSAYRRGQKSQVIPLREEIQLPRAEESGSGGAVTMFHPGTGAVNRGPTPFPRAVTKIQVFHVGRIVNFRNSAQLLKLDRIEERTAAASVQHPGEVFTGQRLVATHREIQPIVLAPNCLAGFFAANTGGKEDLCGSAEQIRHMAKSVLQGTDEPRLRDHVIVQHQGASELRLCQTGIDGLGEGHWPR